jgi:hypothetical protein
VIETPGKVYCFQILFKQFPLAQKKSDHLTNPLFPKSAFHQDKISVKFQISYGAREEEDFLKK